MTAVRAAPQAMQENKTVEIGEDVYAGFVRSLFNDPGILLIGAFCHGLIGILVYFSSKQPVYLALAATMLAAGLYRYYGIRKG
ncbi:MAG: diguanylate phosphodiesterase, partial [Mesorhizobium sp.]